MNTLIAEAAPLDKAMISDLEARRRDALVTQNKTALAEILSDQLIWTHESGVVNSKASYLEALGVRAQFDTMELVKEDVAIFGSTAVVKSEFAMKIQIVGGELISLKTFALSVWTTEADQRVRLTHFQSGIRS